MDIRHQYKGGACLQWLKQNKKIKNHKFQNLNETQYDLV